MTGYNCSTIQSSKSNFLKAGTCNTPLKQLITKKYYALIISFKLFLKKLPELAHLIVMKESAIKKQKTITAGYSVIHELSSLMFIN